MRKASTEKLSTEERRSKAARMIGIFLLFTLICSVIYSFVRFLMAPTEPPDNRTFTKVKTDYLLMLVQCLLGTLVMMLPSILAKRFKVVVPSIIVILYFVNKDKNVRVSLSPIFVAVFAFCFALAIGALWEVYEFTFDSILGLNMQKHTTETGVALVGTKALSDTMKDIIVDAVGALVVVIIGYISEKKSRQAVSEKI